MDEAILGQDNAAKLEQSISGYNEMAPELVVRKKRLYCVDDDRSSG